MENKNIQVLQFLQLLKENNNKEWFEANREYFHQLRNYFSELVDQLIEKISHFDPKISDVSSKTAMFRINRDVRFSSDKSPYKTNFGAYIAQGGRKSISAGYYIHFEHDEVFLAGGIYKPNPAVLSRIRWAIYENIEEFLNIVQNKDFVSLFGEVSGDKLQKTPKEFDKNFKYKDFLKFKDFNVIHYLQINDVLKPNFVDYCSNIFQKMLPFNQFLNKSIEDISNEKK